MFTMADPGAACSARAVMPWVYAASAAAVDSVAARVKASIWSKSGYIMKHGTYTHAVPHTEQPDKRICIVLVMLISPQPAASMWPLFSLPACIVLAEDDVAGQPSPARWVGRCADSSAV